jgi:hypothetical protein
MKCFPFSYILHPIWIKFSKVIVYNNLLSDDFLKIGGVEIIQYTGAYMNCYTYFLYLLSDFNEVSYTRSESNAAQHL